MDSDLFATVQGTLFTSLVATIRTARSLSVGDIPFNRSLDDNFRKSLDKTNAKLLALINALLANSAEGVKGLSPKLSEPEGVDTNWTNITEIVDLLLEKADGCLDESTGAVRRGELQTQAGNADFGLKSQKRFTSTRPGPIRMAKPQLLFRNPHNPLSNEPFKPTLSTKPHSISTFEESLAPIVEDGKKRYPHPYAQEIQSILYPQSVLVQAEPTPPTPPKDTSAIWVDSPELLAQMLEDLKNCTEIAVDLEHHDYRSYIGIVCLMQISSRTQDWIVDALKLRDELQVLNEIFANPRIVKVFHGAFMDIIWLQRDLGLYVVGLFDTYDASKALNFAGHSLAFLLKKYVNFDADKKYQLADWRQRPLPKEMLEYARSDTHFLLFIFDMMKNELLQRSTEGTTDLMDDVLEKSKETSLKIYEHESYDYESGSGVNGWLNILKRNPTYLDPQQLSVFKSVHQWRDTIARREDESLHYVLPKHQLFNLARKMPNDAASLLAVCHPASPLVRERASELCALIQSAKDNITGETTSTSLFDSGNSMDYINGNKESLGSSRSNYMATPDNFNSIFSKTSTPRAHDSIFWGQAFEGSHWVSATLGKVPPTLSLVVPIPSLEWPYILDPAFFEKHAENNGHDSNIGTPGEYATDSSVTKESENTMKRKRIDSQLLGVSPLATAQDHRDAGKRQRKPNAGGEDTSKQGDIAQTEGTAFRGFDYASAAPIFNSRNRSAADSGSIQLLHGAGEGIKAARSRKKDKEGRTFTYKS